MTIVVGSPAPTRTFLRVSPPLSKRAPTTCTPGLRSPTRTGARPTSPPSTMIVAGVGADTSMLPGTPGGRPGARVNPGAGWLAGDGGPGGGGVAGSAEH